MCSRMPLKVILVAVTPVFAELAGGSTTPTPGSKTFTATRPMTNARVVTTSK